MTHDTSRKAWGAGRLVFMARLETIKAEMAQCLSLRTIYERHRAALGIGYPSFCRLVKRHASDARLPSLRSRSHDEEPRSAPEPPPKPAPALPPRPTPPEGSSADVRPQPSARPTFHHHGIVQEGEVERLFGPGYFPKRGV